MSKLNTGLSTLKKPVSELSLPIEDSCLDENKLFIEQAAAMGANVRVGLEDSLWAGPGKLATSNAEQVKNVRQIIEGLGLEIATPDEAREILQLKGSDKVNF